MTDPKEALKAIRDWTLTQPDTIWFDQITTLHDYCDTALAAAAEVGERETTMEHIARDIREGRFPEKSVTNHKWLDPRCGARGCQSLVIEAATIERCAQAAYEWLRMHGYLAEAGDCVAAIRAMKDQP